MHSGISVKTAESNQFLALGDVSGSNHSAMVTGRSEEPSFRFGDREERLNVTGSLEIV